MPDASTSDSEVEPPATPATNVSSGINIGAQHDVIIGGDVVGRDKITTIGYTADQVSTLLTQISATFQLKPFDGRCPYLGLDAFTEDDADRFFGRETLVSELVARVKESRFVVIAGPSGSGKSSVARAGLIHALKQGALPNSDRWLYATLTPGRDPIESLALAMSRMKSPEVGDYLRQHTEEVDALHKCAESVLTERKDQRAIIFVDQFEEVFTQVSKEDERLAFLNLLTYAATLENGRVTVLFALRSDFVSNCATYPQLNALLNQQFMQVGAMQRDELVSAIARPALQVDLRIDPDLVAQIVNDMQDEPGALPLMQFALKDLFEAQQATGGVIALTLSDYLARGGLRKALERHADAAFAQLSENEQQLARSIFSGLIEIGRGTQDTRRTATLEELVPANVNAAQINDVMQKLADARLITTDEQDHHVTVTIAHETLIEAWPWLRRLVNENREAIALQNQIAEDAQEWEKNERDTSYLYSGARLANAHEQLAAQKIVLSGFAQDFVRAGQSRQRRNQMALMAGVVAIIALLTLAVIVFSRQSSANAQLAEQNAAIAATAQANANVALARQLSSQAQSLIATRNSKQMIAILLAIRSMQVLPSSEAAQVLRNSTQGRPVAVMYQDRVVTLVAVSPDGKYVISGSEDNVVRLWEITTRKEITRMTNGSGGHLVAFSPDGKYAVLQSDDKVAYVQQITTGREIARMALDSVMTSAAFSADDRYVTLGSVATTQVWELATAKEVSRISEGTNSLAISPDGKYVALGNLDGTIYVWEVSTATKVISMVHESIVGYGIVTSVAFSPDGRYIASGSYDGTARVWEIASGKEVARMTHDSVVTSVAFSPDGRYVASGSEDSTARLWEVATGKEVARMTHDGWVKGVAFTPDGRYVVSGGNDSTIRVWEVAGEKEMARMTQGSDVRSVAFSPDGRYMAAGSWEGPLHVWEAATGREVAQMIEGGVYSLAFSPDGRYLVSGTGIGTQIWEIATKRKITHIDGSVFSVAFSPNGRYVAVGGDDKTIRVCEAATGKEVARMVPGSTVYSIAFSPDGKYVASGNFDGIVQVWETATEKEVTHVDQGSLLVASVAFSPDGKYVASGNLDYTTRVLESATGKEVARMVHDAEVNSVAFSPDGRYVVSGSRDKTVRVWEVATQTEVARMTHDGVVNSVAFSPDGRYIISGSDDDTVRLWKWQSMDLIAAACTNLPRNLTREEWKQYLGDVPYQAVCPNLPIESESMPSPQPTPAP